MIFVQFLLFSDEKGHRELLDNIVRGYKDSELHENTLRRSVQLTVVDIEIMVKSYLY